MQLWKGPFCIKNNVIPYTEENPNIRASDMDKYVVLCIHIYTTTWACSYDHNTALGINTLPLYHPAKQQVLTHS